MKAKTYISLILIVLCFNSCKRTNCHNAVQDGDETGIDCGGSCLQCPPTVTTLPASAIMATTATVSMQYANGGNTSISYVGVCMSTSHNPTTIALSNYNYGQFPLTGDFTGQLTALTPSTTYYIRGFIENNLGTAYGNEITFTSDSVGITIPTLTTTLATAITSTTATSGGNISSDGGASVTSRGVCYNTTGSPTTASSNVPSGTGTGAFTSNLSSLTVGTTYYVRAYATNSIGTAYGNQITFTTVAYTIPTLTTNTNFYFTPTAPTTAIGGGNVITDGGTAVTSRGICYSSTPSPTTTSSSTTYTGSGLGSFTSNMISLTGGTTYYVRAFAINSVGTAYGNQVSFTYFYIGQSYGGGIIAYIDGSGLHGIIASPWDQSSGIRWWNGTAVSTGATATAIGTGNANTNTIVTVQGVGSYAASLCQSLTLGGYNDWYLPSELELNKLYINRLAIGGFYTDYYWSSSQSNQYQFASSSQFSTGAIYGSAVGTLHRVRAIRSF